MKFITLGSKPNSLAALEESSFYTAGLNPGGGGGGDHTPF